MPLPLIAAGSAIRVPLMVGGAAAYRAATVKMTELGQESMDVLTEHPITGLPHNEGRMTGVDDGYDAFRHAYASAKLTQELRDRFTGEMSSDVAKSVAYETTVALGAAHEAKGWVQGKWAGDAGTEASMGMDLWNNRVGATLGKDLPYNATPEQARDAVAGAFQRGDLITSPNDPRALREYNSHTLEQKFDDLKKAFIGEKVSALESPVAQPKLEQVLKDYEARNVALGNSPESRTSLAAFASERLSPEELQSGAQTLAKASGFHRLTDDVPSHDQTLERQQLAGWMQALEDKGLVAPDVTDGLAVRIENGTPASWEAATNEDLKLLANQGSTVIQQDVPVVESVALAEGSLHLLSIDAGRAREFAEQQPGWTPEQVVNYAFLHEVGHLREDNALVAQVVAEEHPSHEGAATLGREMEADAFSIAATHAVAGDEASGALASQVVALREAEATGAFGEPQPDHDTRAAVMAAANNPEAPLSDLVLAQAQSQLDGERSLPEPNADEHQASAEMAMV